MLILNHRNVKPNFFINFIRRKIFLGKSPVLETSYLNKLLKESKSIKIIDSSFYLSEKDKNEEQIPNSIYINPFDLSENKYLLNLDYNINSPDKENFIKYGNLMHHLHPYPIPDNKQFIEKMKYYDIKKSDNIIIYDQSYFGIYSSARLWFIFKLFGLKNVYVLNGGLKKWKKEKLPISIRNSNNLKKNDNMNIKNSFFDYKKDESKLIDTERMLYQSYNILKKISKNIIIDTRSSERFKGEIAEPFYSHINGGIKCSFNIPFTNLLDRNGSLLTQENIRENLKKELLDLDTPSNFIIYSGIGISSCVLILAFDFIGLFNKIIFYPGSWYEMGTVPTEGNQILEKFLSYENKSTLEQYNDYINSLDPKSRDIIELQEAYKFKVLEIEEKNKEYLKKKEKIKKKEEGDYSSPEELY